MNQADSVLFRVWRGSTATLLAADEEHTAHCDAKRTQKGF